MTHPKRILFGVATVILFLSVTGGRSGLPGEPSSAQFSSDDENFTVWWGSTTEPEMLETRGTLRDPESVQVHLVFQGQDRWVHGWEAVVFLLMRHYVDFVDVNGQHRLQTLGKYKAWKNARPLPNTGGGGPGSSLSGGLDPAEVDRDVRTADQNGFSVQFDAVTIAVGLTSTQPGSALTISPGKLTIVRHQLNRADNTQYNKTTTMDLLPGQLTSGSSMQGPARNIVVIYTTIPGIVGRPGGERRIDVADGNWGATRDSQGVWHLRVPEAPPFLLK